MMTGIAIAVTNYTLPNNGDAAVMLHDAVQRALFFGRSRLSICLAIDDVILP